MNAADRAEEAAIRLEACERMPNEKGRPRKKTNDEKKRDRREDKHIDIIEKTQEARGVRTDTGYDRRRKRPPTRRPRGRNDAQRQLREVENEARCHAVAVAHWMMERGENLSHVAERLDIALGTLRGWIEAAKKKRLGAKKRGRPVERLTLAQRMEILDVMTALNPRKTGLATFVGIFSGVSRAALWDMLCRYRELMIRRHAKTLWRLRWGVVGSVWAMDYAEAPSPIDGTCKYVFALRDLASHCQLAWTPCENQDSSTTIHQLQELFARYGTPLVIKGDNGSPIASKAVRDFIESRGVWFLPSPPETPNYNGAIEAGIGWMKTRTENHAALFDRSGHWTSDDCLAALEQTNKVGRPWGEHGPTPSEAFAVRSPITQETRDAFAREVIKWKRTLTRGRAQRDATPVSKEERDQIARAALRCAMGAQGYLETRRGRITSPVAA